jgi:N-acetylglutamate synthase-like GNAT family acetyltransferase
LQHIITCAEKIDEEEVRILLIEQGLDISGDIEDQVLLKSQGQICAAGKLNQTGNDKFHLEVFGVRKDMVNTGVGRELLNALTGQPWKYCHLNQEPFGSYQVTTVAKGGAEGFYEKAGFKPCSFSDLADIYIEQCDMCPDRGITCQPAPMIWRKRG